MKKRLSDGKTSAADAPARAVASSLPAMKLGSPLPGGQASMRTKFNIS